MKFDAGNLPSQVADRIAKIIDRHLRRRDCDGLEISKDLCAGKGLRLKLDQGMGVEEFKLSMDTPGLMEISAGGMRGLIYGAGKMLRDGSFSGGTFTFGEWRGSERPQGAVRGMYYASHFHNWHHVASEQELAEYTEDLVLWGVNAVMAIYPAINLKGWDDPESEPAIERLLSLGRTARSLDIGYATIAGNTWFQTVPYGIKATPLADPLGRRGNHGHPVCPSDPAGLKYILDCCDALFERLAPVGLDYLCLWPYDEGGCECPECRPWGANGHFKMSKEISKLARRRFPGLKTILSTWCFDTPPEGEWAGLARELAKGNGWLDYIMADAHEDFPEYPLTHPSPGGLPLLNFPEISMWELAPWGGYGANPLPKRLQRLWNQAGSLLAGGFPYSEGIYEDINKVMTTRFYWNRSNTAKQTAAEYIAYECSPVAVPDALRMIDLIETNQMRSAIANRRELAKRLRSRPGGENAAAASERIASDLENELRACGVKPTIDPSEVEAAFALANAIDSSIPLWAKRNWRWRILLLRALLDRERLAGPGLSSQAAKDAMKELISIFHAQPVDDGSDPYHCRVRPPLTS